MTSSIHRSVICFQWTKFSELTSINKTQMGLNATDHSGQNGNVSHLYEAPRIPHSIRLSNQSNKLFIRASFQIFWFRNRWTCLTNPKSCYDILCLYIILFHQLWEWDSRNYWHWMCITIACIRENEQHYDPYEEYSRRVRWTVKLVTDASLNSMEIESSMALNDVNILATSPDGPRLFMSSARLMFEDHSPPLTPLLMVHIYTKVPFIHYKSTYIHMCIVHCTVTVTYVYSSILSTV